MTIGHYIMPSATYSRGYTGKEKARLELFFENSNPSPLLFLQDFDWCRRTKKKFPDRPIYFREGSSKENDPNQYGDATAIFNRLQKFTEYGIIPQVYNEPPGYNRESLAKQVSILIELANKFARINARSLMASWSVGNPDENQYALLKPLFQAIADYNQILNLHEYGTYRGMYYNVPNGKSNVYPYRVGRFTWIIKYCVDNKVRIPDMFIGEWGIDSSQYSEDDGNKRGYKDSRTAKEYALELINSWNTTYKGFANILGTAVFCIGNNGKQHSHEDWRTHDVFNNDSGAINEDYLTTMENFYAGEHENIPENEPAPIERRRTLEQTLRLLQKYWDE